MPDMTNPSAYSAAPVGDVALPAASKVDGAPHSKPLSAATITIMLEDGSGKISIPSAARTFDGFREWARSDEFPESGNFTFVAGELFVDMSPESVEEHSDVKSEISRVLLNFVRDRKLGKLHIDGVLITNVEAHVSNEPDILFLSTATLKSGRLTFTPEKGRPQSSKEIVGTVDWVLEIVSPSSRRKDTKLLREAYFKAGIPEYWLVDVLGDDIDFQILVPGEGGYVAVEPIDGWLASPTFGCSFRLSREKDEDGFIEYTLHIKVNS
jgi:Uma2 family endonuclease